MEAVLYVLRTAAFYFLMALLAAMFVRAVLSWFPGTDDNVVFNIAFAVTEPFIIPVRFLLEKIEWVRNAPLDVSFFVTFLILSLLFDAVSST